MSFTKSIVSSAARAAALVSASMLVVTPAYAAEQEGGAPNLLAPNVGVMFWTLVIFAVLLFVLSRYAYKPLFAAVESREKALEEAVEGAKRNHAESEKHLSEQRALLESAKVEAQKIIADSRVTAEKMRADLLAQTKDQQGEMLDAARRSIEGEKLNAIEDMRREAIELAIAGAGRVIEKNLDSAANRQIVETFLASIGDQSSSRS